ncbi:MAG: hypothetical protein KBA26_07800 [Candidatus Delongbacteria bacterium]|nr:hypothetical protein [Candidatus Delongbacteria bacterium]
MRYGLYAVICLILLSGIVRAENPLGKGVFTLGGEVFYGSSEFKTDFYNDKYMKIGLNPSVGCFIHDRILVIAQLGFQYSESEYSSPKSSYVSKYYYRDFTFGLGFRYYFKAETIIPFIGAKGIYVKDFKSKLEGNEFIGSIGINYFLTREVALEPFVEYTKRNYQVNTEETLFNTGIRVNYYLIP